MPVIYDNALTRAQSYLRDACPENWTIDNVDLVPEQWDVFELTLSFPYAAQGYVEMCLTVPLHLLYELERLTEIVLFEVEGWIVEANDNNMIFDSPLFVYECPDAETINKRLEVIGEGESDDNRAFVYFKTMLSGRLARKRITPRDVGYQVVMAIHQSSTIIKRQYRVEKLLNGKRMDIYRALFPDEPLFAEYCVAQLKLNEQKKA